MGDLDSFDLHGFSVSNRSAYRNCKKNEPPHVMVNGNILKTELPMPASTPEPPLFSVNIPKRVVMVTFGVCFFMLFVLVLIDVD